MKGTKTVTAGWEDVTPEQLTAELNAARQRVARLEEELSRGERRYQSLYNAMVEGVALHELIRDQEGVAIDYRVLAVNPAYTTHTGLAAATVVDQQASEIYGAGEPPYLAEYVRVAETGEPTAFETYFPPMDKHFIISVFSPGHDQFATVFTDITKRKRAEEAVRLYSDAVMNMQIGLYIYKLEDLEDDRSLRMIASNPATEEATGVATVDVLGKTLDECFPGLRAKGIPQLYADVVRSGEPIVLDDLTYGDDRIPASVYSVRAFPLPDRCVGVAFENITERRQAAAERHELEVRLQQAQKMEALGTLAGGVAHDFNNLLQGILGNADLAKDDIPPNTDAYGCLEQVMAGSRRAAELVEQILAFSRKTSEAREPLLLQTIVAEALRLLRAALPATISIERSLDPELGPIKASATQLHQVIMNLASNAAHAMREHGGKLEIVLGEVELDEPEGTLAALPPGRYARFTVKDSGSGMTPQTLERVFEPYFTTKPHGEGTGLGLATIHGIVTAHEGRVVAESTLGRGSTFTVFLPLITADEVCLPKASVAEGGAVGTERVLFVDDDPSIVALAKMGLERAGYTVEGFTSSLAAFDRFVSDPHHFDVVITDQTMPELTGAELARRALELRAECPIILCTGFSEVVDEAKALALGIRGYIRKPILIRELTSAVRKALQPRTPRPTPR